MTCLYVDHVAIRRPRAPTEGKGTPDGSINGRNPDQRRPCYIKRHPSPGSRLLTPAKNCIRYGDRVLRLPLLEFPISSIPRNWSMQASQHLGPRRSYLLPDPSNKSQPVVRRARTSIARANTCPSPWTLGRPQLVAHRYDTSHPSRQCGVLIDRLKESAVRISFVAIRRWADMRLTALRGQPVMYSACRQAELALASGVGAIACLRAIRLWAARA